MAGHIITRLREGVSCASAPEGAVLLDQRSGEYWKLNSSGARSLECLLEGGTFNDAAVLLTREYHVDLEQAVRDVEDVVRALKRSGLLTK
jgi:hypothetical protein